MISTIIVGLIVYFTSLLFHELGHIWYAKDQMGIDVKLKFHFPFSFTAGEDKDYIHAEHKDMVLLYLAGIFAGFIPLLLAMLDAWYFSALFIPYLIGCVPDVIYIYNEFKQSRSS